MSSKKKLISIIIFLISIIILIFVYNDDFLYSKQIVKITKIDTISEETSQNSLGLEEKYVEYLGNKVAAHTLPIRPGRNLAIIVEAAAINHRQKKMGYNAAEELYKRVTGQMED